MSQKIIVTDFHEICISGTVAILQSEYSTAKIVTATTVAEALEVKPEWLKILKLAFREGLQDKAIVQHIYVSERMVRHYWDGIQNALNIDCEELKKQGKNLRTITHIKARELGLIN
jgi:hypothetical protein